MTAKKYHIFVYLCALLFLVVYTFIINRGDFTYDEPYYLTNVDLLNEYGFSRKFIEMLNGPAGPLYGVIHWLLQPLTSMNVKLVRAVNIVFLIGSIICLYKIIKVENEDFALAKALTLLAIPMTFVCAGMALTEMPAMFFLSISLLVFITAYEKKNLLYLCIAGLLMSLAILGRQPYLLYLLAFPVLIYRDLSKINILSIACFLVCALCPPLYIFTIWGGLVPHAGGDVATRELLAPYNLFISMGYSFVITLFLAPTWFMVPQRKYWLLCTVIFVGLITLCYVFDFRLNVMATVSQKILGPGLLLKLYGNTMAAVLISSGLYFLYSTLYRVKTDIRDRRRFFFVFGCLLTLVSSIKITHQFSSRYVFQAAPFFILMFSNYMGFGYKMLVVRSVAILIGIISLLSYFFE